MKRILFFSLVVLLASCGSDDNLVQSTRDRLNSQKEKKEADGETNDNVTISKEKMFEIIGMIPPPVQTTELIKELEPEYNNVFLSDPSNKEKFTSSNKQSLNLGIFGADLAYVNTYGERGESVKYLVAVKHLANELKIGQFFDFNTIRKLATNSNNLDSLINLSQRSFASMNDYLESQGRSEVSAQMLLGGWIEALYLTTKVAESNESERLKEVIGEQTVSLKEIMGLMDAFRGKPKYKTLVDGFDKLWGVYKDVKITYKETEAKMEIVNGVPTMVGGGMESTIEITNDQVAQITKIVNELRTKLIK